MRGVSNHGAKAQAAVVSGLGTRPRRGGPLVASPTRHGFGTRVIEEIDPRATEGEMHFDWRREGLVCEIIMPGTVM